MSRGIVAGQDVPTHSLDLGLQLPLLEPVAHILLLCHVRQH